MFFLSLIEHFLIIEYFFRDECQLINIFFHFIFVEFFHFFEVNVCMINMLDLNRINSLIHEVLNFS